MRGPYRTYIRKKYGSTLKEIAAMYGMTYYRVWMLHRAGKLAEYIVKHSPIEESR